MACITSVQQIVVTSAPKPRSQGSQKGSLSADPALPTPDAKRQTSSKFNIHITSYHQKHNKAEYTFDLSTINQDGKKEGGVQVGNRK